MRSILAGLRNLVVPWGAPTGTPQIRIGPDIPPELITFYAAFSETPVGCFLEMLDAGHYHYDVLLITPDPGRGGSTWAHGIYDASSLNVIEQSRDDQGGTQYGARSDVSVGIGSGDPLIPTFTSLTITGSPARFSILDTALYDIDGISAPRGLAARVAITTPSSAIGATETTVITLSNVVFKDGRAYRVSWRGQTVPSTANTTSYRVRKTNSSGTLLNVFQYIIPGANSNTYSDNFYLVRTLGSGNLTADLVLTLQASTGTTTMTASAQNVRWLEVWDVGADTDFPGAIAI